jgi:hypothetical protein
MNCEFLNDFGEGASFRRLDNHRITGSALRPLSRLRIAKFLQLSIGCFLFDSE